jgi:signal transduction histidine kinase
LKASPTRGVVTVTVGGDEASVFVRVADEGAGVAGRSIDDLLNAAQVQPRAPGSHGLGLRFTRAIALRHGATLSVFPGETCGSVFTLAFPVAVA